MSVPDVAKIPRRSLLPIGLVAAGVVLLGALVVWATRRNEPARTTETALTPTLTAAAAPAVDAAPAIALPTTPDGLPPPPSASAVPESKSGTSKMPSTHAGQPPAKTDEPPKNGKSRVDQRGLAKDNPFK